MVGREVGDNLYFIHFNIVFFENSSLCIDCQQTQAPKYPQKNPTKLVNLKYYEVMNKKCGGAQL